MQNRRKCCAAYIPGYSSLRFVSHLLNLFIRSFPRPLPASYSYKQSLVINPPCTYPANSQSSTPPGLCGQAGVGKHLPRLRFAAKGKVAPGFFFSDQHDAVQTAWKQNKGDFADFLKQGRYLAIFQIRVDYIQFPQQNSFIRRPGNQSFSVRAERNTPNIIRMPGGPDSFFTCPSIPQSHSFIPRPGNQSFSVRAERTLQT